ncbi:MAG: hypothetical protein AB1631_26885 [Acidobacteriota bacterium]
MSDSNKKEIAESAPRWIGPLSMPLSARQFAHRFAGAAEPLCRSWRWMPSAILAGVLPLLLSYWLKVKGHQIASAVLLMLLCLHCVRESKWVKGIALMALAFLAHSSLAIALACIDPQGVASVFPDAQDYWQKQLQWIQSGYDPEYQLSAWVPAHIKLIGGAFLFSYTSLGGITFYEGFYEVDLMNFYNAQLINQSVNPTLALALGWHVWSLLRGAGFLFITYETVSLSLGRLTGARSKKRRSWRWVTGLTCLVADGVTKYILIEAVREQMFANLK